METRKPIEELAAEVIEARICSGIPRHFICWNLELT